MITIYELLGMIKDKQAPRYVKFLNNDLIYEFSFEYQDYINIDEETKIKAYLSSAIGHIELFNYFDKKYIEIVDKIWYTLFVRTQNMLIFA